MNTQRSLRKGILFSAGTVWRPCWARPRSPWIHHTALLGVFLIVVATVRPALAGGPRVASLPAATGTAYAAGRGFPPDLSIGVPSRLPGIGAVVGKADSPLPLTKRARTRVAPLKVELALDAGPLAPSPADDPWALFDGDAATTVRSASPIRLRVWLPGDTLLDGIGFYGGTAGSISVSAEDDGAAFQPVDGLEALPPLRDVQRWLRFPAARPIGGRSFLIEWTPLRSASELREIELWGLVAPSPVVPGVGLAEALLTGAPRGTIEHPAQPQGASISGPDFGVGSSSTFSVDVEQAPRSMDRAFLVYRLSGLPHWTAVPRRINDGSLQGGHQAIMGAAGGNQVEEISPEWLRRGRNEIRFFALAGNPIGYTIANLRIVVLPSGASTPEVTAAVAGSGTWDALSDGNADTGVAGRDVGRGAKIVDLAFDHPSQPDGLSFEVKRGATGRITVDPVIAGRVITTARTTIDLDGLPEGWHRTQLSPLPARGPAAADGVRLLLRSSREATDGLLSELRVTASPTPTARTPRLVVSYPLHGECLDGRAYIRGFATSGPDGARAPGPTTVDGTTVLPSDRADGAFAATVSLPAGRSAIRVTTDSGRGPELTCSIPVDACAESPAHRRQRGAAVEDVGAPFGQVVRADAGGRLAFGGASLEIPPGALAADTRVTIRPLDPDEVPAMDDTLTNVMPDGRGYRFGPHGLKFSKPVSLTLPYDSERIPRDAGEDEIATLFFDESSGRWSRVRGLAGDARRRITVAATEHFTDFINATIRMPDHPTAANFNLNAIKEYTQADPTAGVDTIAPPQVSSDGAAHLSYPLWVPPGRLGMQPNLAMTYNSDLANGQMGVGWDIHISTIQVDTRFGVPTYDFARESETYLLDGDELVPKNATRDPALRRSFPDDRYAADVEFVRRVRRGPETIIRHGTKPQNVAGPQGGAVDPYYWEVIDRFGTHYTYGKRNRVSDLTNPTAPTVLADPQGGGIFEWHLESVVDQFTNAIDYTYFTDFASSSGKLVIQIYPCRISYTRSASDAPAYHVWFELSVPRSADPCLIPDLCVNRSEFPLTGRPGFAVQTQRLIARITVNTGNSSPNPQGNGLTDIIRRYRLAYQFGEFNKTVLANITVIGADGGTFYSHSFDYYQRPVVGGATAPHAFGPLQPWGTLSGDHGLDLVESSHTGANTFGGAGPFFCLPHVGLMFAGDSGAEDTKVVFQDVNGDGIPDSVYGGEVFYGQRDGGAYQRVAFASGKGPGTLRHEDVTVTTYGGGFHGFGEEPKPMYFHSDSDTKATSTLADMDGDALPDLVLSDGTFRRNLHGEGVAGFDATPSPGGLGTSSGLTIDPDRVARLVANLPLADTLVRWTAPYEGDVRIGGLAFRMEGGGDGVIAEIDIGDPGDPSKVLSPPWTHTFGPDDVAACSPGPSSPDPNGSCAGGQVHVKGGQSIYFRTRSGISVTNATTPVSTEHDALSWTPHISYQQVCVPPGSCKPVTADDHARFEPFGPPVYDFDQANDFSIAGAPEQTWSSPFPTTLPVTVGGTISKMASTADDVTVTVVRINRQTLLDESPPLFSHTFASTDVGSVPLSLSHVAMTTESGPPLSAPSLRADKLVFRVFSTSPIDSRAFSWDPTITFESYCTEVDPVLSPSCGPVTCPSTLPDATCTAIVNQQSVSVPVTAIVNHLVPTYPAFRILSSYLTDQGVPVYSRPTVSMPAPAADITVAGFVLPPNDVEAIGVLLVQGKGRLIAKLPIATVGPRPVTFPPISGLTPGEPIYFSAYTVGAADLFWQPSVRPTAGGPETSAPVNARHYALAPGSATSEPEYMSGGHHQWYTGQWNGEHDQLRPAEIKFADRTSEPPGSVVQPTFVGTRARLSAGVPAWVSTGAAFYIGPGVMVPSRAGADITEVIRAFGKLALQQSETKTDEASATVGTVIGLSVTRGAGVTDFLDLDGDGIPDSVDHQNMRLTKPGTVTSNRPVDLGLGLDDPGIRRIDTETIRFDLNLGTAASAIAAIAGADGTVQKMLSLLPSLGRSYGRSHVATDLVDINGDGLPDRVALAQDIDMMRMRLNLGGRFAPELAKVVPAINSPAIPFPTGIPSSPFQLGDERQAARASDVSLNSAQVGTEGIGGGVAWSVQRTYTDLVDVTGDGLPDRVMRIPGEGLLHVQENTGGPDPLQFALTENWTLPDFGPIEPRSTFSLGRVGFGSYDALAFSETRQFEVSAGASFKQVIYPVVCFVEEGSVQHATESTRSQMRMMDVNGDGFADQVLKKDGDSNVYVKLNLEGAQHYNLLKTVHLPLQGTYTLDYARMGNQVDRVLLGDPNDPALAKVDMPRSQWALSSVSVANGPNTSTGSAHVPLDVRTTTFEYADANHPLGTGFYDRRERKDYGYNRVVTNRPDGSVLEELYYNHDFYRQGVSRKTIDRMADGTLFQIVDHTVNLQAVPGTTSAAIPAENSRKTRFYEGQTTNDANPGRTTQQTRVFNDDGDLTVFTDFGEPEVPGDDLTYQIGYRSIAASHIVKADSVTTKNGANLTLAARSAVYNDDGSMKSLSEYLRDGVNPLTGAVYDGSALTNPTWSFTYDVRGNVRTVKDPKQFVLTYDYDDALQTHVKQVTDSLGYYNAFHYDDRFGVPDSTLDANQQYLAVHHDQFGRPFEILTGRDVTNRTIGTTFTYSVGSSPGPLDPALFPAWALATHRAESDSPAVATAQFVDGLGRHIQTITPARQADATSGTESTGINISGLVTYDARSRVYQQFQPGFLPGTNVDIRFHRTPAPATNPTTFSYDLFNRLRATRTPDALGSATDPQGNHVALTLIDFNFGALDGTTRLTKQTKDPLGKVRTAYLSTRGETLGVVETNALAPGASPTTLTTRYAYDPLSRLGTVKDARGNTTTVLYDTESRMISLASPDAGSTEYRYDLGGNLAQKITPNLRAIGKAIKYGYTFSRLDSIVYPTSAPVTFVYGTPTEGGDEHGNVAARIKQIVDESGVEFRKYDDLGQMTEMTKIPAGQSSAAPAFTYTMKYKYDELGRVLSMVYPDGEVVTYRYEETGAPRSVTGTMGSTTTTYVQRINYDQFGHRARVVLGNSALVQYSYFPDTQRLRTQTSIVGGLGGRVVQNLGFTYDLVGNIKQLDDSVAVPTSPPPAGTISPGNTSFTFGYDDLHQLTSATGRYLGCASGCNNARKYSLGMTYDEIGNIKHKTQADVVMTPTGMSTNQTATSYDVGYTYGGPRPHAPTAVGLGAFTYDADGNQLTSTGSFGIARTMTWNEEDRMRTESDRSFTSTYLYDAEGNRTHKRRSTIETVYVNPHYVVRGITTESKHIMVGDTRVATVMATIRTPGNPSTAQSPSYFYYLPDHLQSTKLSTDAAGNILQHDEYFPSGETWFHEQRNNDSRNSQPYMFSAKEQDESGLYYFGARYYDPRVGVWLSPDPILGSYLQRTASATSKNLGLYSYSWNNPLVLTDPDGREVLPTFDFPGHEGETARAQVAAAQSLVRGIWNAAVASVFGQPPNLPYAPPGFVDYSNPPGAPIVRALSVENDTFGNVAGAVVLLALTLRLPEIGESLAGRATTGSATAGLRAAETELGHELTALANRPANKQPAVTIGAYSRETGKVAADSSHRGCCAEVGAAAKVGGNEKAVVFTKPVRSRTGEVVPVCATCQSRFDRGQFPPGTPFKK